MRRSASSISSPLLRPSGWKPLSAIDCAARLAENASYQPRHITRMWPKREDELLNGGSLYWIIKGNILARQRLIRFDEVIGQDGIRRCGLVLGQEILRTQPVPRRPFQGWRYLKADEAPPDLPKGRENEDPLPAELSAKLAEIGIL